MAVSANETRINQLDRAYVEATKDIEEEGYHINPQRHFAQIEIALSEKKSLSNFLKNTGRYIPNTKKPSNS